MNSQQTNKGLGIHKYIGCLLTKLWLDSHTRRFKAIDGAREAKNNYQLLLAVEAKQPTMCPIWHPPITNCPVGRIINVATMKYF